MLKNPTNKLRSVSDPKKNALLHKLNPILFAATAEKPDLLPKRKQSTFLLANPSKLHQLKRQLSHSRNECPNLSEEKQFLSGWKSLFSKRLKRAANMRKQDDCGCRPGWVCLKKRTKCLTKDFVFVDMEPMLGINHVKTDGQESIEFLQRKDKLSTTLQLILQCYDYLRSLHYSERKICQLIKFHCCENSDTQNVLLRRLGLQSPSKSSIRYQYETGLSVLLEKVSAVISRKKGFEVEQFVFSLEEFHRRMERDIEQRSTELMHTSALEIDKRLELLRNAHKQYGRLWSDRHFDGNKKLHVESGFTERLVLMERNLGDFERISGLTRNIYRAMQVEQASQQTHIRPQADGD